MKQFLDSTRPFIQFVSILFAFVAAVKGITEFIPALNLVSIKGGDSQKLAIIAAALALAGKA
jgi:hypothetical protein